MPHTGDRCDANAYNAKGIMPDTMDVNASNVYVHPIVIARYMGKVAMGSIAAKIDVNTMNADMAEPVHPGTAPTMKRTEEIYFRSA